MRKFLYWIWSCGWCSTFFWGAAMCCLQLLLFMSGTVSQVHSCLGLLQLAVLATAATYLLQLSVSSGFLVPVASVIVVTQSRVTELLKSIFWTFGWYFNLEIRGVTIAVLAIRKTFAIVNLAVVIASLIGCKLSCHEAKTAWPLWVRGTVVVDQPKQEPDLESKMPLKT